MQPAQQSQMAAVIGLGLGRHHRKLGPYPCKRRDMQPGPGIDEQMIVRSQVCNGFPRREVHPAQRKLQFLERDCRHALAGFPSVRQQGNPWEFCHLWSRVQAAARMGNAFQSVASVSIRIRTGSAGYEPHLIRGAPKTWLRELVQAPRSLPLAAPCPDALASVVSRRAEME